MATRVTKTGSASVEFAASPTPWHVSDLDADLDGIYNNITASNLATNAVTTPKILDFNVTTGKLAINASTPSFAQANVPLLTTVLNGTETQIVFLTTMNTRGGRVLVGGTISGFFANPTLSSTATFIWRLKRGATVIQTWRATPVSFNNPSAGQSFTLPVWFSPSYVDSPIAGAYQYQVTLQVTGSPANPGSQNLYQTDDVNAGSVFAMELA